MLDGLVDVIVDSVFATTLNIGDQSEIPTADVGPPSEVPEPAAILLLGGGVL